MSAPRRISFSIIFFLLFLIFITPAMAQKDHKMEHQMEGETKVVDGIKGRFKVQPSMGMLDLYLTDEKTDKVITQAKVRVAVISPDGRKIEKDLPGMKMGELFSFMNTLDMSMKGKYSFNIRVDVEKKRLNFPFSYEVK